MTPHESKSISVVLKYFHDGCNSGDLDVLLSTLDPAVIHSIFCPPASLRYAERSISRSTGESSKAS